MSGLRPDAGDADTAGPVLGRLRHPRTDTRVRLAVLADPHVADGHGTWKVTHRSRDRLRTAVEVTQEAGVDATLLVGDLTGDGRRGSFEAVDSILTDLDEPIAVPGNHDVPKRFDDHRALPVDGFVDRYAPAGGYPAAVAVGPVTVLAMNTASARDNSLEATWGGRVGRATRDWLRERIRRAAVPVPLFHHNAVALPENPGGKWRNFVLQDAGAVRELLCEGGVELVISGHHHVPAVETYGVRGSEGGLPTRELFAPAVCSYPQAAALLDIGPEGTQIRVLPLASREGVREARRHARRGKPLGVGILDAVDRRLGDLPLVDDFG